MNELKKALDRRLSMTQWTAGDTSSVLSAIRKKEPEMKKHLPAALIAAMVFLILTAATVLAESRWGVLDWLLSSPSQPETPIETVSPTVLAEKGLEKVSVRPVEAASDGFGLYLSVECRPQEENALLLNASLDPNSNFAQEIGIHSAPAGQTIAAWAKEQGFTSLYSIHIFSDFYSASASRLETFDSRVSAAMRFQDGGSSLVMLAGGCLEGRPYELSYTLIPYVAGDTGWVLSGSSSTHETGTIRFSVPDAPAQNIQTLASYRPADGVDGSPIQIQRVDLLQSPLASYFAVTYTLQDGAAQAALSPIFSPAMPTDGAGAFSWPDLYMQGRSESLLPDGALAYTYFCTRNFHYPPNEFELDGAYGFGVSQEASLLSPVWMIRQDQ